MTEPLHVDLVAARNPADVRLRLTAQPGRPVVLVGPNGAGKTTVLRCVAGLLPLTAGRIALGDTVFDEPATGTFLRPQQRPVGLMFQEHRLFGHLDVRRNIAFGLQAQRLPRRLARQRVDEMIERLNLEALAHRRATELSGGQAQRVALARTLVTRPAVLLLDEPFSWLDSGQRRHAREVLAEHVADFRGAVLLVSHDPVYADAEADVVRLGALSSSDS